MLFSKKKFHIIGLDIGTRTIKLAEVEDSKTGYILRRFGMLDISPGWIEEENIRNPEEVSNSIKQLLKAHKIKDTNATISIGGYSSVIVKNIEMAKMEQGKADNFQESLKFEAEKYIPFDIDAVNLDYHILGESESNPNQMNVLLVAAKKDVINAYERVVQQAGLNPCIMDVDAFALQNVYEANYAEEMMEENVALIDVGATKTTLNILKKGSSVFMRDVSSGCQQINQKISSLMGVTIEEAEEQYRGGEDTLAKKELLEIVETVVTEWCQEIRKALDFFFATYPEEQVRRIVVSGGGANIKKFRQILKTETEAEVEIIDPFRNFSVVGGFTEAYLEQVAPQAAICVGLAIRRVNDK